MAITSVFDLVSTSVHDRVPITGLGYVCVEAISCAMTPGVLFNCKATCHQRFGHGVLGLAYHARATITMTVSRVADADSSVDPFDTVLPSRKLTTKKVHHNTRHAWQRLFARTLRSGVVSLASGTGNTASEGVGAALYVAAVVFGADCS